MINAALVQERVKVSPKSEAVFQYIKNRERHRGDTDIWRMLSVINNKGSKLTFNELLLELKELEAVGVGNIIDIDKARPRFKWEVSPVELSRQMGRLLRPIRTKASVPVFNQDRKVILRKDGIIVECLNVDQAVEMLNKLK